MFDKKYFFEANFGRPFPKLGELAQVTARKLFTVADNREELNFVRLDIGPYNDPVVWLDNVDRSSSHEFHAKYQALVSAGDARFKIVHCTEGELVEVRSDQMPGAATISQPLGDGKYLIVSRRAEAGFLNAWTINANGEMVEQFRVGDAIEALQVTACGNIWTGYSDEGAFGEDPISKKLFSCFDSARTLLFPNHHIDAFGDWCAGLNVESDDCAWLLTNRGGLIRVENFSVTRSFKECTRLGCIFAVSRNRACWAPPLLPADFSIDFLTVSDLDGEHCSFFQIVGENRENLYCKHYAARGSKMYFTSHYDVYVIDLDDVVS